jgi:hypothetical protein
MGNVEKDNDGFTCECGVRNSYSGFVKEHWNVRLVYACSCTREYVLFKGSVKKIRSEIKDNMEYDASWE